MNLRKHQRDTLEAVDGIVAGSGVKNIVADVVPGGGKSLLPVIAAARLIPAGLAQKIAWICPRTSLQDQGERVFLDPRFRSMLGHNLTIRTSTNDVNPSRGLAGWTSTYQALAVDHGKTALRDFERYRYILVLDEWHHLAEDGDWTEPIRELYELAAFRILLTGTLSRGDKGKVAFTPYAQTGEREFRPDFEGRSDTALITYGRKEALAERAIIPLEFSFFDGVSEWRKESGRVVKARLSTSRSDASQAIFTALKTEYAEELLSAGSNHWKNHVRTVSPNGTMMVVAPTIETAKKYLEWLRGQGLRAEIATSDDTPQALKHIAAIRAGKLKILVAVAMISEGLDIPSISHIIYLTNVRTAEWIEQTISRAVRIDPLAGPYESQKGYIFAPADQMLTSLARQIEADQCEAVARIKAQAEPREAGEGNGGGRPGITPLSSRLLHGGQGDLFGYDCRNVPPNMTEIMTSPKTQREIETELREEIDSHVRAWSRAYGYLPAHLNRKIVGRFGKRREAMTVAELEQVKGWLEAYRVPERREPGMVLTPVRRWA